MLHDTHTNRNIEPVMQLLTDGAPIVERDPMDRLKDTLTRDITHAIQLYVDNYVARHRAQHESDPFADDHAPVKPRVSFSVWSSHEGWNVADGLLIDRRVDCLTSIEMDNGYVINREAILGYGWSRSWARELVREIRALGYHAKVVRLVNGEVAS